MTCPDFLIKACINSVSCDEISGTRKPRTVVTNEDVFREENVSVDIQKMKPIPKTTGSQYLTKYCLKGILSLIH